MRETSPGTGIEACFYKAAHVIQGQAITVKGLQKAC